MYLCSSALNHFDNTDLPTCFLIIWSCTTLLPPHELQLARLLCSWDFPGKNTGMSCHFFPRGIFPNQVLNPHLLPCRQIPWRRKWQPTPVFLPGRSHGQRSLPGNSPWVHGGTKESATAGQLNNNNKDSILLLICSYLEGK